MTGRLPLLALVLVGLSGCTAVRPQAAFGDVQATVAERADLRAVWVTGTAEDAAARSAVDSLLTDSLTADVAVQVAILNNRRLQATYEDLGVAQAMLVQAGLLSNPVFGARGLWPAEGGAPDLGLSVAFDFLDVFARPLRQRVARSEYAAAQARVAGAVLDLAAQTRTAAIRAQADAARLAMQVRVVANAEAGYTAARLLREAGNVPAVDLLAEQALYEQARLDLLVAEGAAAESREALIRKMGLSGSQAAIPLRATLPAVPAESPLPFVRTSTEAGVPGAAVDAEAIERAAVAASLDLAARRADIEAAARRLGLTDVEALVPTLHAGAELERTDGEWEAGPDVEVALPLFDQGQARRAAGYAELRRAQALYEADAVDLRSTARTLATRLATARRAALHYQTTVLPLRAEVAAQTLRQYNAMQTGVFGVLQAQQAEAEAARRYFDALAAYWVARTDLDLLLQGRMPSLDGGALARADARSSMPPAAH